MDLQSWGWVDVTRGWCELERFQTPGSRRKKNLSIVSDTQFFCTVGNTAARGPCETQPMETVLAWGSPSKGNMGVCYPSHEHYSQSELPIRTGLGWEQDHRHIGTDFTTLWAFQQAIHNIHSHSWSQSLGFLNIILRKGAFYLFLSCTVRRAGSFTWNILRTQLSHFQLSAGQGSEVVAFHAMHSALGNGPSPWRLLFPFCWKEGFCRGEKRLL